MFPVICIEFLENIWVQPITVPPCLLLTQVERDAVRKRQTRPPTPATRARTARFLRLQNLHFFASQSEDRPATCVSDDNDQDMPQARPRASRQFFSLQLLPNKKSNAISGPGLYAICGTFCHFRARKSPKSKIHTYSNTCINLRCTYGRQEKLLKKNDATFMALKRPFRNLWASIILPPQMIFTQSLNYSGPFQRTLHSQLCSTLSARSCKSSTTQYL